MTPPSSLSVLTICAGSSGAWSKASGRATVGLDKFGLDFLYRFEFNQTVDQPNNEVKLALLLTGYYFIDRGKAADGSAILQFVLICMSGVQFIITFKSRIAYASNRLRNHRARRWVTPKPKTNAEHRAPAGGSDGTHVRERMEWQPRVDR
jgi:hypothetical protein